MKLNKRKVFVVAVALCLVAILSFSTLAWFSDTDEVTNKFNFADSEDDGNVDFSVDVTETDPETGDPVDEGLVFNEILPGDVLKKDPTITNTSSSDRYSQYVRVTLTLKDPEGAWKAAYDAERIGLNSQGNPSYLALLNEMFKTVDLADTWTLVPGGDTYGYNETDKCFYWTFYYDANNGILKPGESATLFTEVQIPTGLTAEDANAMKSSFEVDVLAEAIQAESLNLAYPSADNAFKLVMGE